MWEKAKSVQWVVRASARSEFDKLLAQTPAEILRVDMASVYMDLKDWPFPCFAMLLTWHCILIPGYSPQALGISKIVDFPLVRSSVTLLLCSSSSSEWENREIHWRHGVPNGVVRGTSWNIAEHRGTRYDMIWLTRVLRFFPGFAWKLSGGQTAARGAGESCPLSLSHRGIGHQGCLGLTPGPHQTFLCSCWHRSIIKEIERYLGRKLMKVDHPWSLGIDGPGQKVVNDAAWSFVPWELIRSFSWNTERWSQRRYAYCLNMSFEFDCTAEILRLKLSLSWSIRCFNELQDLICPTFWFRASQDRFECRPAVTGIIAMLSADAPIFATSKQSWVLKWANAWRQNWETEVAFSLLRGSNQGVWAWGLCDCTLERSWMILKARCKLAKLCKAIVARNAARMVIISPFCLHSTNGRNTNTKRPATGPSMSQ